MINLLKILLLKLFSILPDSPFAAYFDGLDWSFTDYLNWFLPLDVCSGMMKAWLLCILFYYAWTAFVKKVADFLVDLFIEKLLPILLAFFA